MSCTSKQNFQQNGPFSKIRLYAHGWPESKPDLDVRPGDLSLFAPQGNGVYGYQHPDRSHPFTAAPPQEVSAGSVVYFGSKIAETDFRALMRVLEIQPAYVRNPSKGYAAFVRDSDSPGKDGYLRQMRIVSKLALRFMFDALHVSEYECFPDQQLSVADALWAFIVQQRELWGMSFCEDRKGLRGLFGGDGDMAREELAFGLMVENEYYEVLRIWSRA